MLTAQQKWPELQALAIELANKACTEINSRIHAGEDMPYAKQCTLELLITELQRRV